MKKYLTPLNIIFATEVLVVVLESLGLIPREAVLVLTGLMFFYVIFSPVQDALWLVIASIPLFVALPLADNFDTLANWRILIAILFLCLYFKQGVSLNLVKNSQGQFRVKENLKHYALEYLVLAFLVIAAASISVANFKFIAVKQLLFLINIFLLFLIVRNVARRKEKLIRLLSAAAAGGLVVLAVALAQFIAVLFVPLFGFWQFWADKVIEVLYGQNLSQLLSYANTWFAYYAGNPPTLRLFSVFPDSHSFAMFCILIIPVFLGLAFYFKDDKKKRIFYWLMTGLAWAGIVFSGSRGAWLSAAPPALVALYFYFRKFEPLMVKKIISGLAVFVLLFLISSGYPMFYYTFRAWQTGQDASTTISFFERARSISNLDELSNSGRLEIWATSLRSIARHPFLGVGLGNYITVLNQDVSAAKQGSSAHNLYLDFASETGIFGVLILIAIFANILYTSWLVFRHAREPYFKFYGLLAGLYFLWVAAYSFFDVVLLNDKVLMLAMVVLAVLYGLRNLIFNPEKI